MSHIFYENRDELSFEDEHPAEAYSYLFAPSAYVFSFGVDGFGLSIGGAHVDVFAVTLMLTGGYASYAMRGTMNCFLSDIDILLKDIDGTLKARNFRCADEKVSLLSKKKQLSNALLNVAFANSVNKLANYS